MSLLSVVTFLPQGLFIDNIAKHMEIGRRAAINQLQQTLCCGGFFFGLPTSGIMSSLLRIRQSQDFVWNTGDLLSIFLMRIELKTGSEVCSCFHGFCKNLKTLEMNKRNLCTKQWILVKIATIRQIYGTKFIILGFIC